MNEIEKEILKYSGNENKIIFDVGCFRGNFTKNIIKNENKREIDSVFFLFDPNPNVKNYLEKITQYSDDEWKRIVNDNIGDLMEYDPQNTKFTEAMNSLKIKTLIN